MDFTITPEKIEIITAPAQTCGSGHIGVVTNHGYSDWATTEIPATVKSMWYRLSRRDDDFCIKCSADGKIFQEKNRR